MSFVFAQYINERKDTKIWVNKKEFHKSKQRIDLDLLNVGSDKFNHSDGGFRYFIGYRKGEIVKPLCIILPQIYWKRRKKHVFCNQRWLCAG